MLKRDVGRFQLIELRTISPTKQRDETTSHGEGKGWFVGMKVCQRPARLSKRERARHATANVRQGCKAWGYLQVG